MSSDDVSEESILAKSSLLLSFDDGLRVKTKQVVFEDCFSGKDPMTLEVLRDLSVRRAKVEQMLNSKDNSSSSTSLAEERLQKADAEVKLVESYLELFESFLAEINSEGCNLKPQLKQRWVRDLNIRWSAPLTRAGLYKVPPFIRVDDLRFERAMVLALLAGLLREQAFATLPLDLVEASKLLRKAAGVHKCSAEKVLPDLLPSLRAEAQPPEALPEMARIWESVCLAEAQAVAVLRAEEKNSSPDLLSKLHGGVVDFLNSAIEKLESNSRDWPDLSSKFTAFVVLSKAIQESAAWKWSASHAESTQDMGLALGLLQKSISCLKQSRVQGERHWHVVMEEELGRMERTRSKWEKENEVIYMDKVVPLSDLPPLGHVQIVSSTEFAPERRAIRLEFVDDRKDYIFW